MPGCGRWRKNRALPPRYPMSDFIPPRIAVLSCAVFERELERWYPPESRALLVASEILPVGLHDRPDVLRERLQAAIDALDTRLDLDAIVLVYGLCGCGTAGLRAGRHRLVIARAHDCITHFLGSKERCAAHHHACPRGYYYTPGWNRERRTPGPDRLETLRAEWTEQFEEDDVAFLMDVERGNWELYDTATFIDLGTEDAESEAAYTRSCAEWLNWRFERLPGDPQLFRDLLAGRWENPERFQIVEPGEVLTHVVHDRIFDVRPTAESLAR